MKSKEWLQDRSKNKPVGERYSFDEVSELLEQYASQSPCCGRWVKCRGNYPNRTGSFAGRLERIDKDYPDRYQYFEFWFTGDKEQWDRNYMYSEYLSESCTCGEKDGEGWINIENGLPDIEQSVEVITEFVSTSTGKPVEKSDRFIGYMDEYGELLILPEGDSYGWQFNDCVRQWRYLTALPQPPNKST